MKFLLLLLALAATGVAAHKPHAHKPASAPIHGVTSVDVYRDSGAIHVLSGETVDAGTSLWHRASRDDGGTFSTPVRVDAGLPAPREFRRGDDAQIAALGDTVVALWSVPGTGWGGSGPFTSAISRDGGKTWRAGANPSDSGLASGHGFADLLFDAKGLHAVWLDNRDKSQGLRYALSKDGTSWGPNASIQPGSCECCWNSLIAHGNDTLVMFRGKGPRDMALAAFDGNAWSPRGRVGAFDWQVKGCPETGGGLAVTPDGMLHALVWTGRDDSTGLHYLRSAAAGKAWSKPVRLGTPGAQHNDLAASGAMLAAVWDDADAIRVAISRNAGGAWEAPRRLSAQGVAAMNPRVVAAGRGFLVLWTEREKHGPWRLRSEIVR